MARDDLNCRRHEDATEWLARYDPKDGHGPVGDQAADPAAMFTQPVVITAWIAGAEAADDEWAIERATGQRQLDEASALIMEAAALFMGYADHHRARADEAEKRDDLEAARASLKKAHVNLSMAAALKEWLMPQLSPGEDTAVAHGQVIDAGGHAPPVVVPITEDWRKRARPGWWDRLMGGFHTGGVVNDRSADPDSVPAVISPGNVRPIRSGPLRDPVVVEGLMAAAGMIDATDPISMATATAFRLQTPDPRFNPAEPVVVNGYLYRPATEALCKTN